MLQPTIKADHFSADIQAFIRLLHEHGVQYVIAGGEAVIYHGHPRLTGDAVKLYGALSAFWDGDIPGVLDPVELIQPGLILQFGRPPNRIDLLNQIDGVSFEEAWSTRTEVALVSEEGSFPVYYLGLAKLIENKRAASRPKDLQDIEYLGSASENSDPD
jgi:hypothetical protein